jgi:hypothetical protein
LQAIHKATHQINLWSFLLPEDIWILDALAWLRSFGLSLARVVGNILVEYKMHSEFCIPSFAGLFTSLLLVMHELY